MEDALYSFLSIEKNSARVITVGPKIPVRPDTSATDVLRAIAGELRQAARLQEFEGLSETLIALAGRVESNDYSPRMFGGLSTTPLHQAFFRAMQMDLEHLPQLP